MNNSIEENNPGRIILTPDQFRILPGEAEPITGYAAPDNFPNCCGFHENVFNAGEAYYALFPNCCDEHTALLNRPKFRKEEYSGLGHAIVTKLSHTEHHIRTRLEKQDWHKDITDYFEYVIRSFGQPAVGMHIYFENLKFYLNNPQFDAVDDKRKKLIEYINHLYEPPNPTDSFDLNLIFSIYDRWLKLFPFEISYFRDLKQKFASRLPLLADTPIENPYTGVAKAPLVSIPKLIDFITQVTKNLLASVNSVQLFKDGRINDVDQKKLELITESHRVNQLLLLGDFSNEEQNYLRIISKWLANERDYYREITPFLLMSENDPLPTKSENLAEQLEKHGFHSLPKVVALNGANKSKLIKLLSEKSIPYKVAMLDFLGFHENAMKQYFNTQYELCNFLAKALSSNYRDIKGNINSLKPQSKENKAKFTAHSHQQNVKKDYLYLNPSKVFAVKEC